VGGSLEEEEREGEMEREGWMEESRETEGGELDWMGDIVGKTVRGDRVREGVKEDDMELV
jgi:hypothetical protein